MSLENFQNTHKLLYSYKYTWAPIDRGYNNRTLYVNVGSGEIKERPVSAHMKEKFTGGKGFGLKLLWDATTPTTRWNDPENEIVINTGPICGITQYSGTGKSLVVTISPQTDIPVDSNVGGFFGPFMKFAGFDSLELQGKSDKDVIVLIDETREVVEIYEASDESNDSHLMAEYLTEVLATTEKDRLNVSVVSAGTAADNSLIGMLNFSFFDSKRKLVRLKQAGRGGIGTVLRDKKIKAVVAHSKGVTGNRNGVVDLQAIMERGKIFNREMRELDDKQCEMRSKGTAHLTLVMND
ncbi:MAG: aldehyde ferredoxin oxidoreductase N-terminal domain-containing protein, partial [Bacteroidales bacterium]